MPGQAVDLTALDLQQLCDQATMGGVSALALGREVLRRTANANTQIEITRLNALSSTISALRKADTDSAGPSNVLTMTVGGWTYAYAMAARVALHEGGAVAGAVEQNSDGSSVKAVIHAAKIIRPKTVAQMCEFLHRFVMICHATGLGNSLVVGQFVCAVVYDTMAITGLSWWVAHELFLVYLEEVERLPGDEVNLSNVYEKGSQDTMIARAKVRAQEYYAHLEKGIFREGSGTESDKRKWNGKSNNTAQKTCLSFNLGTEHPAASLAKNGTCLFCHKCDQWVSDKGPKGVCGSTKHGRKDCDYPADKKADKPVA